MSQETAKKKGLTKPVEVLRQELLADADTQRIAKALKMKLEDYVEMVLDYAQNPDKEPQLQVVPDEQLEAMGYKSPSEEELVEFFADAVRQEAAATSTFGEAASSADKKLQGQDARTQPIASKDNLFDLPKRG